MRLTVSTRFHVINATMYYMHVYMKEYKRSGIYTIHPKSAEPISAQREGIPLNCRRKLSSRNMAYPLQLLYTPGRNPDSPLLLATRTGPQVPCSNPQNGLVHSTCR